MLYHDVTSQEFQHVAVGRELLQLSPTVVTSSVNKLAVVKVKRKTTKTATKAVRSGIKTFPIRSRARGLSLAKKRYYPEHNCISPLQVNKSSIRVK